MRYAPRSTAPVRVGFTSFATTPTPATVHIRDSKNPDGPHLRIPATA
ncbi:DUF397 domain-containing protein [Streptomyces asiaticus]